MDDLRIPVVPLEAEVLLQDGKRIHGRMFLPTAASLHSGSMRPMEWLNLPTAFLPFLPDKETKPIILNKQQVVVLTVAAEQDKGDLPENTPVPSRHVALELDIASLDGTLMIEMPDTQIRVLDLLNSPDAFVTLCKDDRHLLVRKEHIIRVREIGEE
ncbi:MAG: hypothetical protein PHC61_03665 [Chitinivibrionales bacterium]|nr:hypothetical protein [Chitinivibrionales bacterium]